MTYCRSDEINHKKRCVNKMITINYRPMFGIKYTADKTCVRASWLKTMYVPVAKICVSDFTKTGNNMQWLKVRLRMGKLRF